ncbi:MAG: peptidoglycan-associated lipoprotein Pal [Oryzomonas sp.]|uniref:peptidoglycan-associated lipoprotein Pal n=1 Tax=Oryzomonas sp. TaxID=2855186 RepID=UPI00283B0512|nr:peptidoglycan-associated lipoprotein Pal [Oryzomonas sp.]MDR3579777.1 peptidoglycan-associated lipoprotein Pal [Oryzomonas sp.]
MKNMLNHFKLLSVSVLFAAGCANHDIVKKDELVPSVNSNKAPVVANKSDESPGTKGDVKEPAKTAADVPSENGNSHIIHNEAQLQAALLKIYFDFDSYSLSTNARDMLSKNSTLLKKTSGIKLRIEGHCDERGSDEYNLALGEKRARAAMNYLATMGIPAENISILSYGKEKPADPGHNEDAWSKNRRDEFVIVK